MSKTIEGINGGYFPVYWELFDDDNLNYDDVFFFHYLVAVFPILRQQEVVEDKIYKRLGDDFIKAKFQVSSPTITKWFKNLCDNGYVDIWRPTGKDNGPRYYTILLDIDDPVKSGYYDTNDRTNRCKNNSTNKCTKNFCTNNINKRKAQNGLPETISPKEEKYSEEFLPF